MSSHVDDDADEVPFDVIEPIEVGDLSSQQGGVLEAASKVSFTIRKIKVRTLRDKENDNTWQVHRLVVESAIGPLGVNSEGKFAGKVFFPEFIINFNEETYPEKYSSDWWQNEARFPTRQFFEAMGYPADKPPRIDDKLAVALQGREYIADITRSEKRMKNPTTGKYEGTGDYENVLKNFRKAVGEVVADQPAAGDGEAAVAVGE
jgi:hypothetical protein